jgi:uncharacterized protein YciI
MPRLFAVTVSRGPAWQGSSPIDDQPGFPAHAEFMDRLVDEGFVALGGPLEGSPDVLLIVRGDDREEIAKRFAADPWHRDGLLVVKHIWPWRIRLGSLASGSAR